MRIIIEHIHSSGSNQWPESLQKKIDVIHEDIHWMFLIAGINLSVQLFSNSKYIKYKLFLGHVLTVDCEGEPSMIPSEIMHHSIKQSKKVNIDLTLKFLTNQMLVIDLPGSEEAVDDIIK